MNSFTFPHTLGCWARGAGAAARALLAAVAILAATKSAHAACNDGTSRSCTIDGCPGVQVCDGGFWGECTQTQSCGGPPPPPEYDPIGYLDNVLLSADGTSVRVEGWSADQDSFATSIQVEIIVDGWTYPRVDANLYRPDVGTVLPAVGSFHGYSATIPAEPWGTHNVCVRAVNIGTGAPKTLGCQSYTVAGKVTRTWGQLDVPRCAEDPIGDITNLPTTGPDLGFVTGADSSGLAYSLGAPHWQGVSRLAFGDGQTLALSRSGAVQLSLAFMGDRAAGGAPFGAGVSLDDFSFFFVNNDPDSGFNHAGGIQALGSLLAVPNENHTTDDPSLPVEARTQIRFFDLSEPTSPTLLGILGRDVLRSNEAGAVALARLQNNRILMAVGRTESFILDFYVSEPNDLTAWSHFDTWWRSEAHTALPDHDTDFGDYQGINFVTRCSDGALFIVGTHRDGDWFGNDWVDLWQVELNVNSSVLTKVAERHVDCDGHCNLDAGGGVYVTPNGQLLVYGTEHAANGPELALPDSDAELPTVKLREF
jgi:hypothetical protein